jgi:ADP-ribose pyrophosphatase YjhB (NUDIX family)
VVVGTLPAFEDKILLCKRAIEPRVGLWTVPAGFLENGESLLQGAWRETKEETQAEVDMKEILTIFNIPQINQIYVIYRADIEDNSFGPTSESLDVQLFSYDEVPWEELAFPFVPKTINHYYECLETKKFNLHTEDIIRR